MLRVVLFCCALVTLALACHDDADCAEYAECVKGIWGSDPDCKRGHCECEQGKVFSSSGACVGVTGVNGRCNAGELSSGNEVWAPFAYCNLGSLTCNTGFQLNGGNCVPSNSVTVKVKAALTQACTVDADCITNKCISGACNCPTVTPSLSIFTQTGLTTGPDGRMTAGSIVTCMDARTTVVGRGATCGALAVPGSGSVAGWSNGRVCASGTYCLKCAEGSVSRCRSKAFASMASVLLLVASALL